jgi:hypothetical protein
MDMQFGERHTGTQNQHSSPVSMQKRVSLLLQISGILDGSQITGSERIVQLDAKQPDLDSIKIGCIP